MKICILCNVSKDLKEFSKRKDKGRSYDYGNPSGYSSHCKPCTNERIKDYHLKQVEKNPNYFTEKRLGKFGLTLEEWNKLFLEQNGCCKICNVHSSSLKRRLCVDHCHKTGKIRGLLCDSCNLILGKAADSVEILQKLVLYLQK